MDVSRIGWTQIINLDLSTQFTTQYPPWAWPVNGMQVHPVWQLPRVAKLLSRQAAPAFNVPVKKLDIEGMGEVIITPSSARC